MERVALQGLAAFRWGAWAWMVAMLVVSRDDVAAPAVAVGAAGAALGVTVWATTMLHADPRALLRPRAVAVELAVGAALLALDGVVAADGTLFTTRQSLGSAWPFTGILGAGIAFGPVAGALAGVGLGLARVTAVVLNDTALDEAGRVLSLVNTTAFYVLAGVVAGYLVRRLVVAERDISAARARDEVARTLHDGVLQTLALVERRVEDPALARLARDQERELRAFLAGGAASGDGDLGRELRRLAARFEEQFDIRATVSIAGELPRLDRTRAAAVAGAVKEALTNSGKHAGARTVTVFVEPSDDGVFCSVRDDGCGFDPALTPARFGLTGSIRARVEDAGGRVMVRSEPGAGTEVCVWA